MVEVVSHWHQESRDNDWFYKALTYAPMGIREYWILDEELEQPLRAFTLDTENGTWSGGLRLYRPLVADNEGGMDSLVLGVSPRWHEGELQSWSNTYDQWISICTIPSKQAWLEGFQEGRLEALQERWN